MCETVPQAISRPTQEVDVGQDVYWQESVLTSYYAPSTSHYAQSALGIWVGFVTNGKGRPSLEPRPPPPPPPPKRKRGFVNKTMKSSVVLSPQVQRVPIHLLFRLSLLIAGAFSFIHHENKATVPLLPQDNHSNSQCTRLNTAHLISV